MNECAGVLTRMGLLHLVEFLLGQLPLSAQVVLEALVIHFNHLLVPVLHHEAQVLVLLDVVLGVPDCVAVLVVEVVEQIELLESLDLPPAVLADALRSVLARILARREALNVLRKCGGEWR